MTNTLDKELAHADQGVERVLYEETMTLSPEKALQLLAAGEKLRRTDWDDFRYIYLSPCTDWHITDENGNDHHVSDFNDFEVYKE